MRRVATLTGGVALAASLLLVAPVSAAPSQHISRTEHVLFCDGLTGAGGTVSLIAVESEDFGSFVEAAFWPPDVSPETSDPAWIAMTGEAEFTDSSVSGSMLMVEFVPTPEGPPFGDEVGEATFAATLTPDGDPEPYSTSEGSGNHVFRRSGTIQNYTVEGTLTMPGDAGTFDLSSCLAITDMSTTFFNDPASSVSHFASFNLDCFWEDSEIGFVNVSAQADEFGTFTNLFIFGVEEPKFVGEQSGPLTLTTESFEADYDLFDANEGGDPVGSASASATLTADGRFSDRFTFDRTTVHITGTQYAVDGTLSLTTPDGAAELPMDEESCFAIDQRITEQTRAAPKGKPIPNDAPEDATPIAIGDSVTVSTGHTDLAGEEPCVDVEGEITIGHTAWWTFTGTGGEVTIDTAGSDFDTVLGIYTDDGGDLVPIACNDDVDSLQARITVATEAGVTYWIQAGGLFEEAGMLVLSVE